MREPTIASAEPARSHLGATQDQELPITPRSAPLGDQVGRKNRGRKQLLGQIIPNAGWQRVADITGDDQLASVLSITLAVTLEGVGAGSAIPANRLPLVARVAWGTDGGDAEAEIDVVNGTVVTVAASSLRVDVRVDPEAFDGDELREDWFQGGAVSASLGYMPIARGSAQRTFIADVAPAIVDPATPAVVMLRDIPKFARRLRFMRSAPGMTITIELLSAGATIVTLNTLDPTLEIPLPNWADQVRVSSSAIGTVSQIYELWI